MPFFTAYKGTPEGLFQNSLDALSSDKKMEALYEFFGLGGGKPTPVLNGLGSSVLKEFPINSPPAIRSLPMGAALAGSALGGMLANKLSGTQEGQSNMAANLIGVAGGGLGGGYMADRLITSRTVPYSGLERVMALDRTPIPKAMPGFMRYAPLGALVGGSLLGSGASIGLGLDRDQGTIASLAGGLGGLAVGTALKHNMMRKANLLMPLLVRR